jgi:hypothetical protein
MESTHGWPLEMACLPLAAVLPMAGRVATSLLGAAAGRWLARLF